MACLWKGIGLCVNWDPGALLVPAEEPLVVFIKLLLKFVIELPISEDVEEDSLTSLQPFYKIIKDIYWLLCLIMKFQDIFFNKSKWPKY